MLNPLDMLSSKTKVNCLDEDLVKFGLTPNPIAKLLFNSPLERAENAFSVIAGKWVPLKKDALILSKPEILGILDYLGFGLPALALYILLLKIYRPAQNKDMLLRYPVSFVCFFSIIPLSILYLLTCALRRLVAGILTLAVAFPMILVTQPLVRLYDWFVNSKILSEADSFSGPENVTHNTDEKTLKINDYSLYSFNRDSKVHSIYAREVNDNKYRLYFWKYDEGMCMLDETGKYSHESEVSYKEFDSLDGLKDSNILKQVMRVR